MTGNARFRKMPTVPRVIAVVAFVLAPALCAGVVAQGGGNALQSQVVGAGATPMQGGAWRLDGTVAQPSTSTQQGAGGIRLEGGFWSGVGDDVVNDRVFANGFDSAVDGMASLDADHFTVMGTSVSAD